jgi:hypothetical protein
MMDMLLWLETSRFSVWLNESTSIWAYPFVLTLHTLGLAMLVGANAAFGLRALGLGRGVDLASFSRLFPIMWAGFVINFVSGVMLFAKDATTKGTMNVFVFKLGLVVLAVGAMIALRRTVYRNGTGAPRSTPGAKVLAAASMFLWVIAIFAGRFMAYAGMEIFGIRIS